MNPTTVLIVDDDPQVLELYREFLAGEYHVRTARTGEEALDQLDQATDVVLLDRRMPGLSGDEVLQTVRREGYPCRVAMVTAVEPDFDLVDLRFDDYVVKPVTEEELIALVELLVTRQNHDQHVREWLSLLSKRATLRREMSSEELEESAEFAQLQEEIESLQSEADEFLETQTTDQLEGLFRDIEVESVFRE